MLLGLRVGRHIDGFVDAYYGPKELATRASREAQVSPAQLLAQVRALMGELDSTSSIDPDWNDPNRRGWLIDQLKGVHMTLRRLAGESISYSEEVEACYGLAPKRKTTEELLLAQEQLGEVLPGRGAIRDRLVKWREAFIISPDQVERGIAVLSEAFRLRTDELFGLPEGEEVRFEVVSSKPWSGFNYYLGSLKSTVAINIDLPIQALSLGHLIAHEAYPGHHSEHVRKEVGLFRSRGFLEESIFLIGTPQCLISEGLADFGLEILFGAQAHNIVRELLRSVNIRYPGEELEEIQRATEALDYASANAAFRLHEDGLDREQVVKMLSLEGAIEVKRAQKAVEFLTDSTWRAYITCYVEGYRLVRSFVNLSDEPIARLERFKRLITQQSTPRQLRALVC